jgi:hypothetical protein
LILEEEIPLLICSPNKILDSIVIQEEVIAMMIVEVIVIKGMVVEEGEGRRK